MTRGCYAGCPGRAVRAAGRLARGGEHDHPQAGGVPWRAWVRRRDRAAGLPTRPAGCSWRAPRASPAVDPAIVASPAQAQALLGAVARIRPELAAFFGCLYYAALRPEEAIALRSCDCRLPGRGWGMLTVDRHLPADRCRVDR